MRTPLIIANWKMNHNEQETLKFLTRFKNFFTVSSAVEVVICPPFTSLYALSVTISEGIAVKLGAQNCHWEERGAFTGEVSPGFLKEVGCQFVIVGHSERREIFLETNEMIAKKVRAVLNQSMTPIFCVGESLKTREAGQTLSFVEQQLEAGLKNLLPEEVAKVVVAYEPIWAIGSGNAATAEQAQEVHRLIRSWIQKEKGTEIAQQIRVVYGGSVSSKNISTFMHQPDIDGALVGSASLEVDSFIRIVNDARGV